MTTLMVCRLIYFLDVYGNTLMLACSPTNEYYQSLATGSWSVLQGCKPILFLAYVKHNQAGKSAGGKRKEGITEHVLKPT